MNEDKNKERKHITRMRTKIRKKKGEEKERSKREAWERTWLMRGA
jgi:hypothetical protein